MYQYKPDPKHTGRKGYWKPEMKEQTFRLCLLGLTNDELATFFGVSIGTIAYWAQHNQAFQEATLEGRQNADSKVARALYHRAIGCTITENHITYNEDKQMIIIPVEKQLPPDPFSCIKWLSIRQREKWADIQKTELSYNGSIRIEQLSTEISNPDRFSTEELKLALRLGLKRALNPVQENGN